MTAKSYHKTLLATLIGLSITGSAYALEELNDSSLGEATGEGIAFLPQDFSFVARGEAGNGLSTDLANRANDVGYVRLIPVGPLTTSTLDYNRNGTVNNQDVFVGKADIFLYGAALSKADGNLNNRFNHLAGIKSWGTATNPWILKLATERNVPNFNVNSSCATTPDDCVVTYLSYEMPLYDRVLPTTPETGSDAYNLKLGLWADAFVRNPFAAENLTATGTQFNTPATYTTTVPTTLDRANRLRLQMVWDGFSVNGSRLQTFQTLAGVGTTESNQGVSVFANNTLGLAGVLRFNSGDSSNLRANVTVASRTRTTGTTWTQVNGNSSTGTNFDSELDQYNFQYRTVQETVTNPTWSMPTGARALRLSTRETGTTQGKLVTPAISTPTAVSAAPTFDASEGLYFYNPNINLVLGSLYQPLILGTDGRNFNFELTAIPNKPEIYKRIYTDYRTTGRDTSYLGSTCNVHQCGTDISIDGQNYQGYNATHSSISIGSTVYDPTQNLLSAYKGSDAFGVSFGQLNSRSMSGTFQTEIAYDVQYQQRQKRVRNYVFTDLYRLRDGTTGSGGAVTDPYGGSTCGGSGTTSCDRYINTTASHTDWVYLDANGNFTNTTGAYSLYCTTAYACLGGKPVGVTVSGSGDTYTGTPTNIGSVVNSHPGAGTGTNQFIAGLSNCWTGQTGAAVCNGTNTTSQGTHGLSHVKDAANSQLAPPAANTSWNGRAWLNTQANGQVLNGTAMSVFNNIQSNVNANRQASVITSNPLPVAANISPTNNFGSAVIDGLLIQHMKLTTKGL